MNDSIKIPANAEEVSEKENLQKLAPGTETPETETLKTETRETEKPGIEIPGNRIHGKKTPANKARNRNRVSGTRDRFHITISGTLVVGIVVAVFLIIMGIQIFQLKQKENAYAQRKAELQVQYEEETQRAEELESLAAYMKTTQYIEETAKSKLGLAYDNEIIFKEKDE